MWRQLSSKLRKLVCYNVSVTHANKYAYLKIEWPVVENVAVSILVPLVRFPPGHSVFRCGNFRPYHLFSSLRSQSSCIFPMSRSLYISCVGAFYWILCFLLYPASVGRKIRTRKQHLVEKMFVSLYWAPEVAYYTDALCTNCMHVRMSRETCLADMCIRCRYR